MNPFKLSKDIFKALTGQTTESRADESLDKIAGESPRLESLIRDIKQPEYIKAELKKFNSFDIDSGWENVARLAGITEDNRKKTLFRTIVLNRMTYLKWISVAAIVTVVVLAGLNLLNTKATETGSTPIISEEIAQAMAREEEHGLTGAVIEKEDIPVRTWTKPADKPAVLTDNSRPQAVAEMLSATKITTYHDKEYWLELSDGTVVHLGRNSRLVYPDRFTGDTRDVYLEGEAYFMVAKNPKSMFIVHTEAAMTKVYGTEFNISTRDAHDCSIVLVNGSVEVETPDHESRYLHPGEMARVDDGSISISEVDIEPYRAWNTGRVDFVDWPLVNVLDVIAKWYNKEVIIDEDSFSTIEISGSFNRYENLEPTLDALSIITGLDIRSTDRAIHVSL